MNIVELISGHRKGRFLVESQEKLQDLVQQCRETGKKGKLTITFTVKEAEDSTMHLTGEVDVKLPKPERTGETYYSDEQGALHKDDPRQPEFAEVARVVANG